jgi:hypothetical protein
MRSDWLSCRTGAEKLRCPTLPDPETRARDVRLGIASTMKSRPDLQGTWPELKSIARNVIPSHQGQRDKICFPHRSIDDTLPSQSILNQDTSI